MDSEIDKKNMHSILKNFPTQVIEAWKIAKDLTLTDFNHIIIVGMGDSAIAGEILKSLLFNKFKFPIELYRTYSLPEYINSKTLIFAISYLGDTDETLSAFRDANRKGCQIVVVTSGGKLANLADKTGHKIVKVPSGLPIRLAYGYMFFPILRILQNSKLIENQESEVQKLADALRSDIFREKGLEIAQKLGERTPLIYSSEKLRAIAYKWKINFNENSKIHAFCNFFSEMNYNEIEGFKRRSGNYYCFIIKDDFEEQKIKKLMELTKKIIQEQNIPVLNIELTSTSTLQKIISTIYLGDWTSYYTALSSDTDPTETQLIGRLKSEL